MSFWDWLYKVGPGWPSERQSVTMALFGSFWAMLQMAVNNPALWEVKLFEVVFQAISISGILGMVVAFFYAANKADETRTENTGKAFEAITATAKSSGDGNQAIAAAQDVAAAAQNEADTITGGRT